MSISYLIIDVDAISDIFKAYFSTGSDIFKAYFSTGTYSGLTVPDVISGFFKRYSWNAFY